MSLDQDAPGPDERDQNARNGEDTGIQAIPRLQVAAPLTPLMRGLGLPANTCGPDGCSVPEPEGPGTH